MPSQWIYRVHLIVPEVDRTGANELAEAAHPDLTGSFQDANVSADGGAPGTHIYVSGQLNQFMHDALVEELGNWQIHGLSAQPQYWLIRASDGELLASNISAANVGQTWGTAEANTFIAAGVQWLNE